MSNKHVNILIIFSVFLILIVATGCAFASDTDGQSADTSSVATDTSASVDVSHTSSDTSSSDVSSSSSTHTSSSSDTVSATDSSSSSHSSSSTTKDTSTATSNSSTVSTKDTSSSSSSVSTKDTSSSSSTVTSEDTDTASTSSQASQSSQKTESNTVETQQTTTDKTLKTADDGTFTELNTLIQGSDSVTLDKNYVRGADEDIINITNDVNINGNGYTIDVNYQYGAFNITEANVVFSNVSIINTFYNESGMYDMNGSTIEVDNGSLILNNVTMSNNYMRYGTGCVLLKTSNLEIYDSTFTDNYGMYGVVIGSYYGNITINNTEIINSNGNNGAIYLRNASDVLNIHNSKFINNYASNYGGAIQAYRGSTYVYNTEFINNTADTRGGAIYIYGAGSHIYENCVFINNTVNGTSSNMANIQGGAICVKSNVVVTFKNNTMSGNYAYNGSEIYLDSNGKITPVNITVDDVEAVQAEVMTITARVTDEMGNPVTGGTVTFTVNGKTYSAYVQEGVAEYNITDVFEIGTYEVTAVYSYVSDDVEATYTPGTLTVEPGPFSYAEVQALIDDAGAGDTITIDKNIRRASTETNITVNKDIVLDVDGYKINANNGSVFVVEDGATLTVENVVVSSIYAESGGFAYVDTGKLVLNNVTIENSTTTGLGYSVDDSLIYIASGSSLDMNDTVIRNISGAVLNLEGSAVINNSMITNVNASATANGVIVLAGELALNNSVIGNTTSLWSAVYGQTQKQPLIVDNSLFYNNTARSGSGAVILNSASSTITNSVFIANTQTNEWSYGGGVIYARADLDVENCIFINNTAVEKGSIIYNALGSVEVTNSVLIPSGDMTAVYTDSGASTTLDYNWWGTNSDPSSYANTAINNWIVMTTSIEPESPEYLSVVTITTTFDKYTDSTGELYDYADTIPDGLEVTYTSSSRSVLENNVTTVVNGKTVNTIEILAGDTVLEVTQAAQTNTFDIVVDMPDPTIYIIYESNFYEFFNIDGTIIKEAVIPFSELQFAGTIPDKVIVLDQPLNLTSYSEEPVDFQNLRIDIVDGAEGSNITNFTITNNDYSEYAVGMFNVSDVTLSGNVISVTNQDGKARAIYLNGSESNKIVGNIITTCGPSNSITYDDSSVGFADTISIFAFNSSYNVIDSNTVTTGFTTVVDDHYGYDTIVGIDVSGAIIFNWTTWETTYYYSNFNNITNNIITTAGNNYTYGVDLSAASDNIVQGNEITSTSPYFYAAGVQVSDGSEDNIITENTINLKATNITYGVILQTGGMGAVSGNEVSYNNITSDSSTVYLVELYQATNNLVTYNNLKSENANIAMGIGIAKGSGNTITYNEVDVYGSNDGTPVGGDYLPPMNTAVGVYNSTSNVITNNNAVATVGVGDNYAVELNQSTSNTVTDNYLVSSTYTGDDSVFSTSDTNTIQDNIPTFSITVDGTNVKVSLNLGDDMNGKVILKVNGKTLKDDDGNVIYVPIVDGVASYEFTLNASSVDKNYTISYVYSGSAGTARGDRIITISPQNAIVSIDPVTAMAGETITLRAYITDEDGNKVTSGKVVFKLNGVSLRDADGNVMYAYVDEAGYATLTYTIPDTYSAKEYVLTVVFQGSGFERADIDSTLTLTKSSPTIQPDSTVFGSDNSITITQGTESVQVKATIVDPETQAPITTTTVVTIKINDKTVTQEYVSNGQIDMTIYTGTFKNPSYTLTIVVGENSIYNRVSFTGTLTVLATTSMVSPTSYNGTLETVTPNGLENDTSYNGTLVAKD